LNEKYKIRDAYVTMSKAYFINYFIIIWKYTISRTRTKL